jgi:hypothetical protein
MRWLHLMIPRVFLGNTVTFRIQNHFLRRSAHGRPRHAHYRHDCLLLPAHPTSTDLVQLLLRVDRVGGGISDVVSCRLPEMSYVGLRTSRSLLFEERWSSIKPSAATCVTQASIIYATTVLWVHPSGLR